MRDADTRKDDERRMFLRLLRLLPLLLLLALGPSLAGVCLLLILFDGLLLLDLLFSLL